MELLFNLSVWIHIVAASLLVGGTFFSRVLLNKYAERTGGLSDELRETLHKRWLHIGWNLLFVLLVTGFFQFFYRNETWKAAPDDVFSPHAIFGIKFLVFLVLIGTTAILTTAKGKRASLRPPLAVVNLFLGFVILLLSVWLVRVWIPTDAIAVQEFTEPSVLEEVIE